MPINRRVGGSFAPPITKEILTQYQELVKASDNQQLSEVMLSLCEMVSVFHETPESQLPGTSHPSGKGMIIPLDTVEKDRIFDVVPWAEEIEMYRNLFNKIPVDSELRNPAFHLLWYATELEKDREPITTDKL